MFKPIATSRERIVFSDLTAFYLTISFENICTLKRGTSSRIQIIVTFIYYAAMVQWYRNRNVSSPFLPTSLPK